SYKFQSLILSYIFLTALFDTQGGFYLSLRRPEMDKNFKVLGINHIGLAPKNPDKAKSFFSEILGLTFHGDEHVHEQKTLTSMFASSNTTLSGPRLEVLAPANNEGPIAAFLEKKGSGIHHIALMVDSVDNALTNLKKRGIRFIDETPRSGA